MKCSECAQDTGSSLCLVYGLENCVDFLSSAVVLWRFFAPRSVDEAIERKLQHREQRANVAIGFIIVILGLSICIAALMDFQRGAEDNDEKKAAVVLLSFFSIPVFGVLSCLKFRYAVRLDSPALYKDGICSLIGTILAIALFVNTLIIESNSGAWWIDPVVALIAGVFAILYGIRSVWAAYANQGLPIFSCAWWMGKKEFAEDSSPRNTNVEMPPTSSGDVHDVV